MRVKRFLSSTFLTPADVEAAGSELTASIQDVEEVEPRDGPKLMLVFEGDHSSLVLNQTNIRTLAKAFGDNSDDWLGNSITLFCVDVEVQGEMRRGIRIRPPQTTKPRPVPRGGKPDIDRFHPFLTSEAAMRSAPDRDLIRAALVCGEKVPVFPALLTRRPMWRRASRRQRPIPTRSASGGRGTRRR